MALNIIDEYGMELDLDIRLNEIFDKIVELLDLKKEYDLSLTFVSNPKIQEINKEYRNIDKETDVISFAILDGEYFQFMEDEVDLGDIFISVDKAQSQANDLNQSLNQEIEFLFIHGVLHLLGYDHMNLEEETEMFSLQRKIVDAVN